MPHDICCADHVSAKDTTTLCVILLLAAVHIGGGYLWLHNYHSHIEVANPGTLEG